MKVIKPLARFDVVPSQELVFLAGSIEMGRAENWQQVLERLLKDVDVTLLNPRRDDWDSSWEQSIDNQQFRGQVEWELQGLELSDHIIIYFSPGTKSPITLLELGLYARDAQERLTVCCPEGFWRKGNVDIVCRKYGITQVVSVKELADEIIRRKK